MSTEDEKEPKTMGEKAVAFMKGKYKYPDHEYEGFYEETHVVRRLPVSHFKELQEKGFKNKTIAQMYGLSEMKVRKILKNLDLNKSNMVHKHEFNSLRESRIMSAKKIVDNDGHEIEHNDIIEL